ncbi:MAG: carboxypeptidase-like regulatory domain-containing protein [Myxococcales bacterium]|nr:carboxypeptidase-like regulatory domain-containing protein [Myxococcota bacterium]MDW8282332.1 carboxypeptidase-like regulatory domain-containing protein [Myxococcales bacterium]
MRVPFCLPGWRGCLGILAVLATLLAPRLAGAIGEVTGRIGGYVTIEGTGEGVADVLIQVSSKALLGGTRSGTTRADGSYTIHDLPPGIYDLTVRMEGFAPILHRGIRVNAGELAPVDIQLQVQTTPQQNQTYRIVEKVNPTLNPESAAAVVTIGNASLTRAPTFRQEKGVAQHAPGVTQGTDRVQVRGAMGRHNRYLIDGLDLTDIVSGAFGTSSALINHDSVEQFVIAIGAMDAEFNSLGLVQNMITRSGGNKLTIDATVILQPTQFSAPTRYATRVGLQQGQLLYDDRPQIERAFYSTNLNLGGPIVKDRLWFFTSFQFNYNRITNNIPPVPWYPGLENPYDRYVDQTLYIGRAKLTWQASQNTRVSVSYSFDRNYIANAIASSAIGGDPTIFTPEAERRVIRGGDWGALLIDSLLTPKLLLQIQTGLSYKSALEDAYATLNGEPDRLTPSHTLATADAFNNLTYLNGNRDWNDEKKWNFQFAPTLLYTAQGLGGTHNIKGGLQFAYMRYEHNVGVAGGRRFTDTVPGLPCDPQNPATFSSCLIMEEFPDSQPRDGRPGPGWTTTAQAINLGFFIQDRFTFQRYLTVVPGFRIDMGQLFNHEGSRLATLVGYGPRLSFIYDLLHDRSTLLVAHYGRHNDVGNAGIADRGNPTQPAILRRWNPTTQSFEEVRRSGGVAGQTFAQDVEPPKVDEVSAGIHREVHPLTVAGVDYTYRLYSNLWINREINQIWDPAGTRVVGHVNGQRQQIFEAATPPDARREYHGVDFWVRGTPGRFDVIASYTLSFLRGTVEDYFDPLGYGYNPRLSHYFYGDLPRNYRHYIKALLNYGFDFGLTLGARLQYLTGAPQWKVYRSPEDQSLSLYRSPRGSDPGARVNDPTGWSEFRLPDQFVLDLQVAFSMEKLLKQRIDILAMAFNALSISTPFQLDQRDGPNFGTVTRRTDNIFVELVVRYRY